MASVCGSTLALMDAGVPVTDHGAGVAMGLILKGDKYAVLTDIQGLEDALGEMDFKVAGTKKGCITALQMDIKVKGITLEIMREAMEHAKKSRYFIIVKLAETIAAPRAELAKDAPRMIVIKIDPAKIKTSSAPAARRSHQQDPSPIPALPRSLSRTTALVFITSLDGEAGDKARQVVENLTKEIVVGETYLRQWSRGSSRSVRSYKSFPVKKVWHTSASASRRNASNASKMSSTSAMRSR